MKSDLKKIFSKIFDIPEEKIGESTTKENVPEWDSFNHLLLVSEIEKELSLKLTMEQVEKATSFKKFEELLSNK